MPGWRALPILLAAAIVLAACGSVPAPVTPPLTKIETRSIGPEAAEARALDQLRDILEPSPFPNTRRPKTALSDMWFWTRPRATPYADVCETQRVIIEFEPVGLDKGALTEVRATGLSVSPRFHFLTPPVRSEPERIGETAQRRLRSRCAELNPARDPFVGAEDARTAIAGTFVFQEVLRLHEEGEGAFELECPRAKDGAACRELLAGLAGTRPERVDRCERYDARGGCWSIDMTNHGRRLTILTDGAPSAAVSRVIVDEVIVLVDYRID